MRKLGNEKITNLIICLVLGAGLIITGLLKLTQDINIDLNKAKSITGEIMEAGTKTIMISGIKRDFYLRVFYFRTNNSEEIFTVHRDYEGYDDLVSKIQPGDTIKLYYRPGSREYNRTVYQIEKKGLIIEDYKNYNYKTSNSAALACLFGVIIVVVGFIYYYKFNVWKFLNNLVR